VLSVVLEFHESGIRSARQQSHLLPLWLADRHVQHARALLVLLPRLMAACCVAFSIFAMNKFYDAVKAEALKADPSIRSIHTGLRKSANLFNDSIELESLARFEGGVITGRAAGAGASRNTGGQRRYGDDDDDDDGAGSAPLIKHHSW
jgi:hypothetical protein